MRIGPYQDSAAVVERALSFRPPGRVPVFDSFWPEFEERWRAARPDAGGESARDYYWVDLEVPVANECFFPSRAGIVRREGADVYRDDGWGRIIRTRLGTWFMEPVERVLRSPADLDRIEFEAAGLESRYEGLVAEAARHRALGRAVFVKIGGVFLRTCWFRGEPEFLMDLVADRPYAAAVVEKVSAHLLAIGIESVRRTGPGGFGVWVYDDMCNARGPMFSPAVFEAVFLPVYRRMVTALKAAGAPRVFLHCDGNLTPLLDLVVEAGFDGINPVEYGAGMDVCELLPRYWGRLSFVGGVCNTRVLPGGRPAEIRRHIERLVEAGRGGGLVLGTHSIGPDIPVESYELYRRTALECGGQASPASRSR